MKKILVFGSVVIAIAALVFLSYRGFNRTKTGPTKEAVAAGSSLKTWMP